VLQRSNEPKRVHDAVEVAQGLIQSRGQDANGVSFYCGDRR